MLNKKESFLRRDQAVSWLWACRKVGFNRDVSRLVANEVFDGFKYVNGTLGLVMYEYTLRVENGGLINNLNLLSTAYSRELELPDHCRLCYSILRGMALREFSLNGHSATVDEIEAIMEILQETNCSAFVRVRTADWGLESIQTFGDVLKVCPKLGLHCPLSREKVYYERWGDQGLEIIPPRDPSILSAASRAKNAE